VEVTEVEARLGQEAVELPQLAHSPAGVRVQTIPDQYDRAFQLLVRPVQEPGVVLLGEPLRLSLCRARCVRKIGLAW
jgi:hypothetical protein